MSVMQNRTGVCGIDQETQKTCDIGEENMTRREIRDKIFKIIFTAEFNTPEEMSEQIQMAFDTEMPGDEEDDPMLYASVSDKDKAYITDKVMDILAHRDVIDSTISEISEGWNFRGSARRNWRYSDLAYMKWYMMILFLRK